MRIYWEIVIDNAPQGEDAAQLFFLEVDEAHLEGRTEDEVRQFIEDHVDAAFQHHVSYAWWKEGSE